MTTFIPKRILLGLFSTAGGGRCSQRRRGGYSLAISTTTSSRYFRGRHTLKGPSGEKQSKHRLYVFPFIGAVIGFTVAILLTTATQVSYPLVTGGKPILAIPPMAIITYEGTMLGAIIFTVLGIIFESRLPRAGLGMYDERITEGYIGVVVTTTEDKVGAAEEALTQAGAEEIKQGEPD